MFSPLTHIHNNEASPETDSREINEVAIAVVVSVLCGACHRPNGFVRVVFPRARWCVNSSLMGWHEVCETRWWDGCREGRGRRVGRVGKRGSYFSGVFIEIDSFSGSSGPRWCRCLLSGFVSYGGETPDHIEDEGQQTGRFTVYLSLTWCLLISDPMFAFHWVFTYLEGEPE